MEKPESYYIPLDKLTTPQLRELATYFWVSAHEERNEIKKIYIEAQAFSLEQIASEMERIQYDYQRHLEGDNHGRH